MRMQEKIDGELVQISAFLEDWKNGFQRMPKIKKHPR